jgi:hypothetical protein
MQKILIITTTGNHLRSSAIGWSAEDGDEINQDKPIGCSMEYRGYYTYITPMHAIGDGWNLLVPPCSENAGEYEWWFVKD